jgi:predicted nucleic acid-binding protein
MSVERVTYLDSSALVKLAVREPESQALRRYLGRRRRLVCSALARVEVARALMSLGEQAIGRGDEVLSRIDLVRINHRVLRAAAVLMPAELRSLGAIHLATAQLFESELHRIVTYDNRMVSAAEALGWRVEQPG